MASKSISVQGAEPLAPPVVPKPTQSGFGKVRTVVENWITPRSANRDEAFRERTIRLTSAVLLTILLAALIVQRIAFPGAWTLVSIPTLLTVASVLVAAASIAISRGQVDAAGYLLTATVFAIGVGVTLALGYDSSLIIPIFILTLITATLVIAHSPLLLLVVGGTLAVAIVGQLQTISPLVVKKYDYSATIAAVNAFFFLLPTALFLRQLRGEFDARLTALRDSLAEAERARADAERANKAKTQFLANMSHELRTPMNAVIGYSEIMIGGMAGDFTPPQTELLTYIHQNSGRLLGLINDVLDLSRIESGKVTVTLSPNSPRKIINEVVSSIQSLAQTKNLQLTASYAEGVPEIVMCDVGKLQQILTNLIGNAVKFTRQGAVDILVEPEGDDRWRFAVRDTGIGMPTGADAYIFEAFRQVDNSDTRAYEGTGLGLAITKQLVETLGGTIAVKSTLNVGSTFTVTLPRNNAAARPTIATPEPALTALPKAS